MIRVNKNIGAHVEVYQVITDINPTDGWKIAKKVPGVIVENKDCEYYYIDSNGSRTCVNKHVLKRDVHTYYAVKLDNDLKDVAGNNIIPVREFHLKFLDRLEIPRKPVSEKSYMNAKETVKRYEAENRLEPTVFKNQ